MPSTPCALLAWIHPSPNRKHPLATPNYGYEKRQRELAKKRKAEEKLKLKEERKKNPVPESGTETDPEASDTPQNENQK